MATRPIRVWSGSAWEDVAIAPFDSDQFLSAATASATYATQSSYAPLGRNLIINGSMNVAQRGTSASGITGGGYHTADRWQMSVSALGTWTQSVETDAPIGSGLTKSLRMLCTTADTSPSAGDFLLLNQRLEGQDVQRISKGTSDAQQLTVSFWVKSNLPGTYVVQLEDTDNSRSVSATYLVSSSATWERKIITFPADTTGTLTDDNNLSLMLQFWLGAGTNWSSGTMNTTWASQVSANRAVGQTNLAAATNNYWQITGVQLEVGLVATPFEFEPYEATLRKCQRYYWRQGGESAYQYMATGIGQSSTANVRFWVVNPVVMRAKPSSVEIASLAANDANNTLSISSVAFDQAGSRASTIDAAVTGAVAQRPYFLFSNATAAGYIAMNAEL